MTLTELQKADWKPLTKGVDHISTEKASDTAAALDFKMIGYQEGDSLTNVTASDLNTAILGETVKEHLTHSAAGYLRFDISRMTSHLSPMIFFNEAYDSTRRSFPQDSTALISIPGIVAASFISKEKAKKEYIADGNQDWSAVLDTNPLPDAIHIQLADKKWTATTVEELKSAIVQKLGVDIDFQYSNYLVEENKTIYFFEYKRKK